jgi:hypothetical protein
MLGVADGLGVSGVLDAAAGVRVVAGGADEPALPHAARQPAIDIAT